MKKFRCYLAAAVAAVIFMAQPVLAAEGTPVVVQPVKDYQSGGPGVAVQAEAGLPDGVSVQPPAGEDTSWMAGQEQADQQQIPGDTVQPDAQEQASQAGAGEGGSTLVGEADQPGDQPVSQEDTSSQGATPVVVADQPSDQPVSQEDTSSQGATPVVVADQPGDQPVSQEDTSSQGATPVVVAGQAGDQTVTGPAAQQAAREEAERQAAEEAARQAEEEAARQAAEEAARQAAEEAARQAAEGRQVFTRQIDPARPMVALTFDDGPQASVGNRIMDCLAQYGGKATFFMVGSRVPAHAAEVQRMVAEGHEVANHTMNHRYLQKLDAAQIQAEVNQCNDTIQAVCGVRPMLMRLPGGNKNDTVIANVHMPMIQWNIDTLDWKTRNADKTVEAVLNQVKDGDIVLMHELYTQTGDAALRIIPELVNRGYQLVTVSEMAAAKGRVLEAGKLYFSLP